MEPAGRVFAPSRPYQFAETDTRTRAQRLCLKRKALISGLNKYFEVCLHSCFALLNWVERLGVAFGHKVRQPKFMPHYHFFKMRYARRSSGDSCGRCAHRSCTAEAATQRSQQGKTRRSKAAGFSSSDKRFPVLQDMMMRSKSALLACLLACLAAAVLGQSEEARLPRGSRAHLQMHSNQLQGAVYDCPDTLRMKGCDPHGCALHARGRATYYVCGQCMDDRAYVLVNEGTRKATCGEQQIVQQSRDVACTEKVLQQPPVRCTLQLLNKRNNT